MFRPDWELTLNSLQQARGSETGTRHSASQTPLPSTQPPCPNALPVRSLRRGTALDALRDPNALTQAGQANTQQAHVIPHESMPSAAAFTGLSAQVEAAREQKRVEDLGVLAHVALATHTLGAVTDPTEMLLPHGERFWEWAANSDDLTYRHHALAAWRAGRASVDVPSAFEEEMRKVVDQKKERDGKNADKGS